MGFMSGVTPEIDRHHVMIARLGERYLKIRTQLHREESASAAFELEFNSELKKKREFMLSSITSYFLEVCLDKRMKFEYSENTKSLFVNLAMVIEDFRTPTYHSRDEGFQSDIEPQPAYPTRLVMQLHKLAKMLCVLRGNNHINDQFPTIFRVAIDTLPRKRAKALVFLYLHRDKQITESLIRESLGLGGGSVQTLKRQLLQLHLIDDNWRLKSTLLRRMSVLLSSVPQLSPSVYRIISSKREKKSKNNKESGGSTTGVWYTKEKCTRSSHCQCKKCVRKRELLMREAFEQEMFPKETG